MSGLVRPVTFPEQASILPSRPHDEGIFRSGPGSCARRLRKARSDCIHWVSRRRRGSWAMRTVRLALLPALGSGLQSRAAHWYGDEKRASPSMPSPRIGHFSGETQTAHAKRRRGVIEHGGARYFWSADSSVRSTSIDTRPTRGPRWRSRACRLPIPQIQGRGGEGPRGFQVTIAPRAA